MLRHEQEAYQIIGAAMKVHSELRPDSTEKVHQEALAIELAERAIPCEREKTIHATHKGIVLNGTFVPDFICFDKMYNPLNPLF